MGDVVPAGILPLQLDPQSDVKVEEKVGKMVSAEILALDR
jgi:hypothetical protein